MLRACIVVLTWSFCVSQALAVDYWYTTRHNSASALNEDLISARDADAQFSAALGPWSVVADAAWTDSSGNATASSVHISDIQPIGISMSGELSAVANKIDNTNFHGLAEVTLDAAFFVRAPTTYHSLLANDGAELKFFEFARAGGDKYSPTSNGVLNPGLYRLRVYFLAAASVPGSNGAFQSTAAGRYSYQLQFGNVPEPSSAVLVLLCGALGISWRRRGAKRSSK